MHVNHIFLKSVLPHSEPTEIFKLSFERVNLQAHDAPATPHRHRYDVATFKQRHINVGHDAAPSRPDTTPATRTCKHPIHKLMFTASSIDSERASPNAAPIHTLRCLLILTKGLIKFVLHRDSLA